MLIRIIRNILEYIKRAINQLINTIYSQQKF